MEILKENYVKIGIPESPKLVLGSIRLLEEAGFLPVDNYEIFPRPLWFIPSKINIIIAELNFIPDDQIPGAITLDNLAIGISNASIVRRQPLDIRNKLRLITGLPPLYFGVSTITDSPVAIGRRRTQPIDDKNPVEIVSLAILSAVNSYEMNKPSWAEKYDR